VVGMRHQTLWVSLHVFEEWRLWSYLFYTGISFA